MATSLSSRPLDLLFFCYFAWHIPTTIVIDLQALLPAWVFPQAFKDLLAMYIQMYRDPFMGAQTPMPWFVSFIVCEALTQFPFFFYACYGIRKDSPHVRLPLLVYGAHVMTTVIPIVAELAFNQSYNLTTSELNSLLAFYVPYFIIPFLIVVDSYRRVSKALALARSKKD
ncbi:Transmembrane protein 97 [Apophysomyces sp. BC1034]|nr:Transmembrane protein 97 [Apophysomyces sp. BC1015]KAG0173500.1 Transmembrane protein 97 [Apophysomyces sp. BC1021]KAG0185280.1 Transmembrane protein 97 [Apophysomyces sp. BC1034]